MSLKLITTEKFGELDCNFYRNSNDEILLTREQIGTALEYSNPRQAISKIHNKYKDRFEGNSGVTVLDTPSGRPTPDYKLTPEFAK